MLTEVTGRPAQVIRRLPNRLILMSAVYLVYDAPEGQIMRRAQKRLPWASQAPLKDGVAQTPRFADEGKSIRRTAK